MSVVDFEAKRKEAEDRATQTTPHLQGRARCLACKHEWEAVAPCGVTEMECPQCACLQGRWRNYIMPPDGTPIWTCDCGNDLHFVSPTGIWCGACGVLASFPT